MIHFRADIPKGSDIKDTCWIREDPNICHIFPVHVCHNMVANDRMIIPIAHLMPHSIPLYVHKDSLYIVSSCGRIYQYDGCNVHTFICWGPFIPVCITVAGGKLWGVSDRSEICYWDLLGDKQNQKKIDSKFLISRGRMAPNNYISTWLGMAVYTEVKDSQPPEVGIVMLKPDGSVSYFSPHLPSYPFVDSRTAVSPSKPIVWKEMYCIGCYDGSVVVLKDPSTVQMILRCGRAYEFKEVTAMNCCEDFLYVEHSRKSQVFKWDISGNLLAKICTKRKSGMPLGGTILFGDKFLLRLFDQYSANWPPNGYTQELHHKKYINLYSQEPVFKWRGGLFSECRGKIYQWTYTDPWSIKTHTDYPKKIRKMIKTMLLLSAANKLPSNMLPRDVLYHIFALCVGSMPFLGTPKKKC